MKTITFVSEIANAGDTRYIPVPCRGVVHSAKYTADAALVADKTVIISRDTDAVNTATAPTGDTAAGAILEGVPTAAVPPADDRYLIFDPDSATVTDQVLKIIYLAALVGAAATVTTVIEFDDAAYVKAAPSEA